MRKIGLLLSTGLFILIFVGAALGHGLEGGQSQVVGDYKVELGYDEELLAAGKAVPLTVKLESVKTGEGIEFSGVNFQISHAGGHAIFDALLAPTPLKNVEFTFTFPQAGSYNLSARFLKGGDTLAEATFPVTISGGMPAGERKFDGKSIAVGLIIGLIVGAAFLYFIKKT